MADDYDDQGKPSDKAVKLKKAKTRLEAAWQYDKDNREEALKDLRFLALDQWPEDVRTQRQAAGRPVLTLDHLNQHKNQVVNDIRQAKIGMKAIPVDNTSDPDLADVVTSLMRDVQYQSHADHVHAMAADGAVSCGIGHFRFKTRYVKDRVFEQELLEELIPYPLAVYWDPAAVQPDRSDAEWCFVTEFVPTGTFESRFPKAKKVEIDVNKDSSADGGLFWSNRDGVLLAEYWKKVQSKRRLVAFEDGSVIDLTDIGKDAETELIAQLGKPIGEREAEGNKIEQCLLSGAEILSEQDWAGQYLPIIPVIGSEIHLENKTVRMGLIRGARDPQQLYNYWRSAAAELIALAPKSKWLVTDTQIAPYKHEWDSANTSPTAYLRYKPDPTAASVEPKRIAPPDPPAAIWQEAALVVDDMKAATGLYDASLGNRSNEQSGVAIQRRQQEGDVSTYHFADNLNRSLEHAGRVMIDLIPKIYDTQRVVRIMGEDDEHKFEHINWPTVDDNGEPITLNDLTQGRYDIRVSVGPSYTTQRLEARDALIDYIKADPQAVPIVRDLIARTLDFDGAEEMAERFKKTIPPQYLSEEEQQGLPQQQPDPTQEQATELALKEQGAKVAKTEGDARKSHADADAQEMENAVTQAQVQGYGVPPPDHMAESERMNQQASLDSRKAAQQNDAAMQKAQFDVANRPPPKPSGPNR